MFDLRVSDFWCVSFCREGRREAGGSRFKDGVGLTSPYVNCSDNSHYRHEIGHIVNREC